MTLTDKQKEFERLIEESEEIILNKGQFMGYIAGFAIGMLENKDVMFLTKEERENFIKEAAQELVKKIAGDKE